MTVQLYSRPLSRRLLSNDPLCFYFHYYVHDGVDGQLSVHTEDNDGDATLQWTLRVRLLTPFWQFAFVQINAASGPFQVTTAADGFYVAVKIKGKGHVMSSPACPYT